METRTYTVYKFNELPEDAREKALCNLYDLNVDHDWWDSVYDDAGRVGIKITSFDTDRGNCLEADYTEYTQEIAREILTNHGEKCDTYSTAKNFLDEVSPLDEEDNEDKIEELETEFLYAIREDYLSILRKEYEYLTTEEAIIESIEANDYDFTINGKIA